MAGNVERLQVYGPYIVYIQQCPLKVYELSSVAMELEGVCQHLLVPAPCVLPYAPQSFAHSLQVEMSGMALPAPVGRLAAQELDAHSLGSLSETG